jgi:hypothetical protein
MITPQELFRKFDNETLLDFADKRNIALSRQQKKKVKDILIDDVIKTGVTKILSNVLKASTLKLLCEHTAVDLTSYREERKPKKDTDSDEKPPSYFPPKSTLARILVDVVNEAGPEAFFKSFEIDTLIFVCHDIDDLSDYIVKKENKGYDFKKLKDKYAKKRLH